MVSCFTPLLCPLSLSHLSLCSPLFLLPSLNLRERERLQIESIIERAAESEGAGEIQGRVLVGRSTHEALVYAQICFGRALQSEQSYRQQQRLHILSEALKVNIITSAFTHASATALFTPAWECV